MYTRRVTPKKHLGRLSVVAVMMTLNKNIIMIMGKRPLKISS